MIKQLSRRAGALTVALFALGLFGLPFFAFVTFHTFAKYNHFHRPPDEDSLTDTGTVLSQPSDTDSPEPSAVES